MSETHVRVDADRSARRPRATQPLILLLAVAVLAAFVLIARQQETHANAEERVDIVYLFVSNEGPTAKAWYDGAPSPGVPVQDALDKFAKEGYRVAHVAERLGVKVGVTVLAPGAPDQRTTVDEIDATAFVILLERVR